MTKQIKLGQKVQDIVTGLTGIATARIEYMNGCFQIGIKQKGLDKDGETFDAIWVDIEQVKIVGQGVIKVKKVTNTGGDYNKISSRKGLRNN